MDLLSLEVCKFISLSMYTYTYVYLCFLRHIYIPVRYYKLKCLKRLQYNLNQEWI